MSKTLTELQGILMEGQRRSMQGSCMRRKPAPEATPFLVEARSGLKAYVKSSETEAQAWRLLSQAEECLLNYGAARRCLENALSLSELKDTKDLKRLALLREHEVEWAELKLTPDQLEDLGRYLQTTLADNGCDHTLRFTQEWLQMSGVAKTRDVTEAMRNRGGYCDCEVLSNVVTA